MNLICMSFDGEYVTEQRGFKSVEEAWDRFNDMGSRWYFYPFGFVTTNSGKTVKSAPYMLEAFEGMRVKQVQEIFAQTAARPDMQDAGVDTFAFALLDS